MGIATPKQFLELDGKPILMHTIERLHSMDTAMQLVLVLPKDQIQTWNKLKSKHGFRIEVELAEGGATRFLSVKSGLSKVSDADVVGVHDGVRPFASAAVINDCFQKANEFGAAVPAVPVVQSLRQIDADEENKAVDRSRFRAIQTPQCFQYSILEQAYSSAKGVDYSDDASVVEETGVKIQICDGNEENIKITSPLDLELAQLIISRPTN